MQGGSGSVTIHEVAEKAGVSIKTVSRVINHEANVRADTKQRVLAVIAELNYRPNPSARHLAGTHGYNIALLYDNPSPSYLIDLQRGALESCQAEGFHLILQPCGYLSRTLESEIRNLVDESRVPGLILSPPLSDAAGLIEKLEEWGVLHARIAPIDIARPGPYVAVDDRGAAFELIRHLIELGHRRIAIIKGHPDHGAGHWRYEGYLTAMRQYGLPIDDNLIVQGYFSFEIRAGGGPEAFWRCPTGRPPSSPPMTIWRRRCCMWRMNCRSTCPANSPSPASTIRRSRSMSGRP